jgi:integrase
VSKAWKVHNTLQTLQDQGLPIKAKSLNAVIDEYVEFRGLSCEQGVTKPAMLRQIKRVAKFFRAYAGTKPIHQVGDDDLRRYVPWRREYYSKLGQPLPRNAKLHPKDKTIQWEVNEFKAIIRWANHAGWRGNKPLPVFSFAPKLKGVRPAFELAEYRRLWRTLWKRVGSCSNPTWRATRELLRDYVLILANSGIRVGEANDLRIRDVIPFADEAGRDSFQFKVRGKTGERIVIPRATSAKFIKRVLAHRAGADVDDLLFVMPSGRRIITLAEQFDAALEEAGVVQNSRGEKYTLYSLRHFYAVMHLRRGLSVYALCRNMGTSVQMIEAYYGKHATAPAFAAALGN